MLLLPFFHRGKYMHFPTKGEIFNHIPLSICALQLSQKVLYHLSFE